MKPEWQKKFLEELRVEMMPFHPDLVGLEHFVETGEWHKAMFYEDECAVREREKNESDEFGVGVLSGQPFPPRG